MKKYLPLLFLISQSYAASFVVPDGVTETTTQTLTDPGDTGLIEEGGAISTTGIDSVYVNGADNAIVTNNGNIAVSGVFFSGINIDASDGVVVNNNGSIITSSNNSIAIRLNGSSGFEINNNGSMSNLANFSSGVYVSNSSDGVINNSGTISATSSFNTFIELINVQNVTINNTGNLIGNIAGGMGGSLVDNIKLYNGGEISVAGNVAVGISMEEGANITAINEGTITAAGNISRGVQFLDTEQSVLVNKGLIEVTGTSGNAVLMGGNDLKVINSGTISSTNGYALNFDGMENTLALEVGSIIKGRMITTGDTLDLEVAKGLNAVLTLDDAGLGFGEITSSSPYIVIDNTAIFIDRTGFALEADLLADLSDSILGSIYQSRFGFGSDCCVEEYDCGLLAWVQGVGSYRKRHSSHCSTDYTIDDGGVLAGVRRGDFGLFGGVVFGNAKAAYRTSKTNTVSYVAGLSYERLCGDNFFGTSVALGYVNFKNDRYIANNLAENGLEKAHHRKDSFLFAPELTWSRHYVREGISPNFTAQLRYAALFHGSATENGSAYNMRMGHRSTQLLTGRFEASAPYCCASIALEPYIGGYARWQVGNKSIDAAIEDVRFSFNGTCRDTVGAFLYGLRASKANFYLNVEGSVDNYASNRVLGQVGFSRAF